MSPGLWNVMWSHCGGQIGPCSSHETPYMDRFSCIMCSVNICWCLQHARLWHQGDGLRPTCCPGVRPTTISFSISPVAWWQKHVTRCGFNCASCHVEPSFEPFPHLGIEDPVAAPPLESDIWGMEYTLSTYSRRCCSHLWFKVTISSN